MTDRNTTVITGGDGGGSAALGIILGVLVVLGVAVFVFGWHPWGGSTSQGPNINITVPTAPAPAAPTPAPAPKPAG